jgi:hypothetical protein
VRKFLWLATMALVVGCSRDRPTSEPAVPAREKVDRTPVYVYDLGDDCSVQVKRTENGDWHTWFVAGSCSSDVEEGTKTILKHFGLKDDSPLPPDNGPNGWGLYVSADVRHFDDVYYSLYQAPWDSGARRQKFIYRHIGSFDLDENRRPVFLWLGPDRNHVWVGEEALKALALVLRHEQVADDARLAEHSRLLKPVWEARQRADEEFKKWDRENANLRGYGPDSK